MPASSPQPRRFGRSIGSILAAMAVVVVLSLGMDVLLHATGVYPPWGQPMSDGLFALAAAYRMLIGIGGAYLTALLAPYRPMLHSLAGAVIGMALATAGAVATWNRGPEFGPHWYPILLIVGALPTAWIGAKLYLARHPNRSGSNEGARASSA